MDIMCLLVKFTGNFFLILGHSQATVAVPATFSVNANPDSSFT